jgi:hypothetical protein
MTVQELKNAVAAYRQDLKKKYGKMVTSSESGPVGVNLFDSVVAVLETLQKRIEELERRIEK